MKIIINQPRTSYFVGGAEMISMDHAINFYKLGHEVYFFTILPKSVGLNYSKQFIKFYKDYSDKIKIIEIEQDSKIKYIYDITPGEDRCRWNAESIYYNQKLYEYVFAHKKHYDIIFSYYNLDAVFVPKNKISSNVLYLCGIPKNQNDFQGSFLLSYDKVLAISSEVKDSWKKYSKDEIRVVSTGVDLNRFSLKKFNKNKSQEIILLYVGRLISRKNVDKIIYAFENLYKKYKLKLFIVGDGPDRKRLENISSHAIFVGVVPNTEKYYKQADIFISPSFYGEGLQGTILEAMSCGLTVIATNNKINKMLLANKRGFITDPTIESIVENIEKAINSDRIKISKNARNYVFKNYDWKTKSNEIMEVIK